MLQKDINSERKFTFITLLALFCNTIFHKHDKLQYFSTDRGVYSSESDRMRGSKEAGAFSWLLEGPTMGLRTPSSQVPHSAALLSPPLPPPPVLGPLIKAGLSATAAHQGAPHPHLQQHCLLGVPLWCTHMGANTQGQMQEPTYRFTHRSRPPKKVLLIFTETASRMSTRKMWIIVAYVWANYRGETTSTCEKEWEVCVRFSVFAWACRCPEVCTWVHKFTQVHMCFCQVKETGNVIQSTCYASTEQTHYALGAAFSTYKQTPEQTSTTACLHM